MAAVAPRRAHARRRVRRATVGAGRGLGRGARRRVRGGRHPRGARPGRDGAAAGADRRHPRRDLLRVEPAGHGRAVCGRSRRPHLRECLRRTDPLDPRRFRGPPGPDRHRRARRPRRERPHPRTAGERRLRRRRHDQALRRGGGRARVGGPRTQGGPDERRPRDGHLHLGHDRQSEGGGADPRKLRGLRAQHPRLRARGHRHARRPGPPLPAPGPHHGAHRLRLRDRRARADRTRAERAQPPGRHPSLLPDRPAVRPPGPGEGLQRRRGEDPGHALEGLPMGRPSGRRQLAQVLPRPRLRPQAGNRPQPRVGQAHPGPR